MQSGEAGTVKRRGRKRKRIDVQNVTVDQDGKKRLVETRSKKLVGRYVRKDFEGSGVFLGKIIGYDSGLYRIDYEDGDCEDLDSGELKSFLIEDIDLNGEWLERKRKLDDFCSSKDAKARDLKMEGALESGNAVADNLVEVSRTSVVDEIQDFANVEDDDHQESSSDSLEGAWEQDQFLAVEVPVIPPPDLPPSSGHIGVHEEYVSHLLSVYSFLRSFSIQLFLYPFGLDDFVGALNCSTANTLLDSIHVALMRALRRHLERLSSEGSELAARCLRRLDWCLLDTVTWPVHLVNYLMVMKYADGPQWKGFYDHALQRDYYTLSAGRKLVILQILCDDVLDSEDIRVEIDTRQEAEVGTEIDVDIVAAPTSGPRRVHPRYSKTSARKDHEAINVVSEHQERKSSCNFSSLQSQLNGPDESCDVNLDGNGDECLLCGMDGVLLCCDGCPSSYHSRCLGLAKMYMPEGAWYCPECTINEPKVMNETALRGGESLGVDPYEQVFVATCDHLLVMNASNGSGTCLRYYSKYDIPRVLEAICTNAQHAAMYSDICKEIMQYWKIPTDFLPRMESENIMPSTNQEKTAEASLDKSVPKLIEGSTPRCVTGVNSLDMVGSSLNNSYAESALHKSDLDTLCLSDQKSHNGTMAEQSGSCIMSALLAPHEMKSAAVTVSVREPIDHSELSQKSNLNMRKVASYDPRNSNVNSSGLAIGSSAAAKIFHQEITDRFHGRGSLYMGSSFKRQGYINYYLHGDFAASAAANLAHLSSEENQVSESHMSDNRRKLMSASISLQIKAFSSAAIRFFWPNAERKLVEVPRERCSWCFSCKAPVMSKRGCLLNAAAANATKVPMKVLTGLRLAKNVEGSISGIATYIMLMEESLSGLVVGPFLNEVYRKQWRKHVEQATTCNAIKPLLLEFEENVRTIALSGDWTKLIDGCLGESSVSQTAVNAAGSTQRRRPGRRGRKPSIVAKPDTDEHQDILTSFTVWKGGALSKLVFQRGTLPSPMIRKAARQGGTKKIPGIHYVEGFETSKRSRQLVWRAAVEMSRNVAQLAFQVRYLDFHVRWGELIRPEQIPSDGKGPETEASVFRNAYICDKKVMGSEIRYSVAFGSQKHLPSRVMKSVTEVEQSQDGKERYWFSETKIPLYLIKEYEENLEKEKTGNVLFKLPKRKSRGSRKNIFLYLVRKRDNMENCLCASCHANISLGNAVNCSICQGLCHEGCVSSSTTIVNEEVEFLITCKHCSQTQVVPKTESSKESPTSPLLLRGQDFSVTSTVDRKKVTCNGSSASRGPSEPSEAKPKNATSAAKAKKLHWGLIWKKKNTEDNGIDFRLKNILLRGNPDMDWTKPLCRLCSQPYNCDLMYIKCETCQGWYHADALELEESKIFDLVGFKCCKCRRLRSPVCPYMNPAKKKSLESKRKKPPKSEISALESVSGTISEPLEEEQLTFSASVRKEGEMHVASDDPLLVSLSNVEQGAEGNSEVDFEWNNFELCGSGPQKLPVRRHTKPGKDLDSSSTMNSFQVETCAPFEANILNSGNKLPVRRHMKQDNNTSSLANDTYQVDMSPQIEWDVSKDGFDDTITLDYSSLGYEDMEFEPQTYFSFNELLASDDGSCPDGVELPGTEMEKWENSTLLPNNPSQQQNAAIHLTPCKMCAHTEPSPNLCCQTCGMWIHSHCSPWVEQSSWENGWKCGSCREWR